MGSTRSVVSSRLSGSIPRGKHSSRIHSEKLTLSYLSISSFHSCTCKFSGCITDEHLESKARRSGNSTIRMSTLPQEQSPTPRAPLSAPANPISLSREVSKLKSAPSLVPAVTPRLTKLIKRLHSQQLRPRSQRLCLRARSRSWQTRRLRSSKRS